MGFIKPSRELAPAERRRGERTVDTSLPLPASRSAWLLSSRCPLAACTVPDDHLPKLCSHIV